MLCMENKKIMIVLSEALQSQAKLKADNFFAGNFSAYIAHCITKDLEAHTLPTVKSKNGGNTVIGNGNIRSKTKIKK